MIENTTKYDKKALENFQKEKYGFTRLVVWSILAAILCIIVTFYCLLVQPRGYVIMCAIFGSLMFIILISIIIIGLNNKKEKQVTDEKVYNYKFYPKSFSINEDGDDEICKVDYSFVKNVFINEDYIYIYIDNINAFLVSKKTFVNRTDILELIKTFKKVDLKITYKNEKSKIV